MENQGRAFVDSLPHSPCSSHNSSVTAKSISFCFSRSFLVSFSLVFLTHVVFLFSQDGRGAEGQGGEEGRGEQEETGGR